jgi:cobalt-precorrin-5B (C1)-methyltransferase
MHTKPASPRQWQLRQPAVAASVVLATGRRSEKYAPICADSAAGKLLSWRRDFIGYSLRQCARRNLDEAVIWGMIGKLSKLAAGSLYTNISDSRVVIDFLSGIAAACGLPGDTVANLRTAITANHCAAGCLSNTPEYSATGSAWPRHGNAVKP